ncbi:MAG: carbohydrate kinase [Treponema sp.]|nr:carbohydrate kinase [Treponema sp.]
MQYLLGLDIGQTKIKTALFTVDGEEYAAFSGDASCMRHGDFAEKDMIGLWKTVSSLLRTAASQTAPGEITAIGVSGHGNGLYPLDKEGRPFINAVLSTDSRAQSIVDEWNRDGKGKAAFRYTVQHIWAGQPLPILEWFKRNSPETYRNIGTVLFCKDYINYMLTGNCTTDYSDVSAAGVFDNVNKRYDRELFGIFALENRFPAVIKSVEKTGRVSIPVAAETGIAEDTVVAGGCFDAVSSALGSGALGGYSITAGTWSINAAFTDSCVTNGKILQCNLSGDGERWFAVESSPTSAVNLEWYVNNIRSLTYKECDEIAGKYDSDDVRGIYMPYINSMPRYPRVKSGFFGDFKNENEKLRALFEGIAFGHRFHLENLREAGIVRSAVRLSGGLATSALWCQILADVLQLPVEVPAVKNPGCLGAALCAGIAASLYPSLEEAVLRIQTSAVYNPRCSYDRKYKLFKKKLEELNAG